MLVMNWYLSKAEHTVKTAPSSTPQSNPVGQVEATYPNKNPITCLKQYIATRNINNLKSSEQNNLLP